MLTAAPVQAEAQQNALPTVFTPNFRATAAPSQLPTVRLQ